METHSSVLVGESRGQRTLVSCGSQGCTELDTTEATQHICLKQEKDKLKTLKKKKKKKKKTVLKLMSHI